VTRVYEKGSEKSYYIVREYCSSRSVNIHNVYIVEV